jgi:hypothetical protein
MPKVRMPMIPIEEVALFLFFIFAITMISLPFLALFLWSKGFRWILVLILIMISAGYLASRAGEDTESHIMGFEKKKKATHQMDEVSRATDLLCRGEVGYTLSQDVVYERMAGIVRKGLIVRGISERDMLASTDNEMAPLRGLLRHEKRKGSWSVVKRLGFKRDREFMSKVSDQMVVLERWLNEDI